jgi:glycosyltransferase EpsH
MMPLVSIIVPVFNAERYLPRCFASLSAQTLKELEIIAIDNGSTDKSLSILEDFAKKDNRIRILTQEKRGPAACRNLGLRLAQGKYIGFVDADDWIEHDMYASLYFTAESVGTDLVICNYIMEANGFRQQVELSWPDGFVIKKESVWEFINCRMIGVARNESKDKMIMGFVWRCLYSSEALHKSMVLFEEEISYAEDLLFNLRVFSYARNIVISGRCFYHYCLNESSLTRKYEPDLLENCKRVNDYILTFVKEEGKLQLSAERLRWRRRHTIIAAVANVVKHGNSMKTRKKLDEMKDILNLPEAEEVFSDVGLWKQSIQERLFYFFCKKKFVLSIFIYYSLKNNR